MSGRSQTHSPDLKAQSCLDFHRSSWGGSRGGQCRSPHSEVHDPKLPLHVHTASTMLMQLMNLHVLPPLPCRCLTRPKYFLSLPTTSRSGKQRDDSSSLFTLYQCSLLHVCCIWLEKACPVRIENDFLPQLIIGTFHLIVAWFDSYFINHLSMYLRQIIAYKFILNV